MCLPFENCWYKFLNIIREQNLSPSVETHVETRQDEHFA